MRTGLVVVATLALVAQPAAAIEPVAATGNRQVTLVTGDRVVLLGGDAKRISLVPRPGRQDIVFRTLQVNGRLSIIPSDVAPRVAAGLLDRRLFDITGLLEAGYDDGRSRSIPLIISYAGPAGSASVRNSGADVVRELPVIDGAAVRVRKGSGIPPGVDRVWLDGMRRTTLDESVPRIGGPAGWQAGLTGKGVTIAVLDTGIDAAHPDLAGQVAEARNFTDAPAGDQVGHGTHVASTIAGTDTRYRGVAPDATLLDGKVCAERGCPESAILAAMQWAAVEKRADIVNLSLGGPDSPEIDPVEAAVDTLTAQTGTLFVAAAGNRGAEGIDSPGSAGAALTVGAVDRKDAIADFSGRGPRVGDGGVKPDITAPGVDIVAARSKDGWIGDPVGDRYVRLSGTSMATPHVAGSAALLAQQHPDWTAADLKAALMASAKPHPDQTSFEQGAGRVDLVRAITQTAVAEPVSLSFGTARWPHGDDEPVVKRLTYRNYGDSAVTLALDASLHDPDGRPSPGGALRVSASSVVVPGRGTASVDVTSNTRHEGPDGGYSGRLTASGPGGVQVVTPVGLSKEIESYDLTVDYVDLDGRPAESAVSDLVPMDGSPTITLDVEAGTSRVRLPKGRYFLAGFISVGFDAHQAVQPILRLDKDTKVVVDARQTRPIDMRVPRSEAKQAFGVVFATLESSGFEAGTGIAGFRDHRLFTAHLGELVTAPDKLTAIASSLIADPGPGGNFVDSPYVYGLVNVQHGQHFRGLTRVVKDSELAKVVDRYHSPGENRRALTELTGFADEQDLTMTIALGRHLPSQVTNFVEPGPTRWYRGMQELGDGADAAGTGLSGPPNQDFQAGRTYIDRWNAAVLGPAFPLTRLVARYGDDLHFKLPMYSDQHGHRGSSVTDTDVKRLYRNGVLIAEEHDTSDRWMVNGVPAAPGDFRLVSSTSRPSLSRISVRTDAEWTFRSQHASEDGEGLPLWAFRYFPVVDDRNFVTRQPVSVLPVKLQAQPGAPVGSLTNVDVWVSGDDGTTWTKAAVRRTGDGWYRAMFSTPKGGHVSLKAKAADSHGNATEQTIIRAYLLR